MKIKEMLKRDMSKTMSIGTNVYIVVALLSPFVLNKIVTEQLNSGLLVFIVWFFAYIFFLPVYVGIIIIYSYITDKESLSSTEIALIGFIASLIVGMVLFVVGIF